MSAFMVKFVPTKLLEISNYLLTQLIEMLTMMWFHNQINSAYFTNMPCRAVSLH